MIILVDGNVWEKLAEFFEKRDPRSGTVIIEKHLIGDRHLHWVCDLGGKRLLGRVELDSITPTRMVSINGKLVKAAGFGSKEMLKRTFATYLGYSIARELDLITVAQIKIAELERYWCPKCQSVNLDFLKKNIILNQLPFGCFDCSEKFYTEDREQDGPPWIKHAKLEKRYCKEEIKRIPSDQQAVLAIAGEEWKLY